ncbi:MAG: hypothetical protein LBU03_05530 [Tannerellaceae bacterium]|jgi:hypothetical protein|nr:hypothetical protein [Tannerellaceae bacterium]
MKIVTTREIRSETKTYFELAEKERVSVKRGKKYVNLIVSNDPGKRYVDEDWITEFMAIPAEYRVNPFEVSPSGDLFYADKRNLEQIDRAMASGKGRVHTMEEISKMLEI